MAKDEIKISKFLSFVLRHKPDAIGLSLDPKGWAHVPELLDKATLKITYEDITEVVKNNEKKRFALSPDGQYTRASQGHSVQVDLGLKPVKPPKYLHHGTVERFIESIEEMGLLPQSRLQVHLSSDVTTAYG